jgi:hypothetical protein
VKESMIGGALVTMALGVGLGIMGFFIAIGGDREALYPLIGVALLAHRRRHAIYRISTGARASNA